MVVPPIAAIIAAISEIVGFFAECFIVRYVIQPTTRPKQNDPKFNTPPTIDYNELYVYKPLMEKGFRLNYNSPCIDSGTNVLRTDYDFDGKRRPVGARVELGIYGAGIVGYIWILDTFGNVAIVE